jgi:hypothetical protein
LNTGVHGKVAREMQIAYRKNPRDEKHSTFVAAKVKFAQLVFATRVRREHGPVLQKKSQARGGTT